ncbi:MAG: hypothetical protein HRT88_24075 [Lentisphaeraceae bacterium]|nr:hypothetical protein [Lentisphaeraceae bacterium]
MSEKKSAAERKFQHKFFERKTGFTLENEKELKLTQVYEALTMSVDRNELIIKEVSKALDLGRSPLVLTERKDHLQYFTKRAEMFCQNVICLHGGYSTKRLQQELKHLKEIPANQPRIVLAIGSFIGEGFDDCRFDTLFLTYPLSWKGRLQQYAGRLHRDNFNKSEVQVYDYVDEVGVLQRMYKKRLKGYRAIGYSMATPEFEEPSDFDDDNWDIDDQCED